MRASVGSTEQAPRTEQVLELLRKTQAGVVVNLLQHTADRLGRRLESRPFYHRHGPPRPGHLLRHA